MHRMQRITECLCLRALNVLRAYMMYLQRFSQLMRALRRPVVKKSGPNSPPFLLCMLEGQRATDALTLCECASGSVQTLSNVSMTYSTTFWTSEFCVFSFWNLCLAPGDLWCRGSTCALCGDRSSIPCAHCPLPRKGWRMCTVALGE